MRVDVDVRWSEDAGRWKWEVYSHGVNDFDRMKLIVTEGRDPVPKGDIYFSARGYHPRRSGALKQSKKAARNAGTYTDRMRKNRDQGVKYAREV